MLAAVDVLRIVARNGPINLAELEATVPAGDGDAFWMALDAAVDHGWLRMVGYARGSSGCYQLTGRGRRALETAGKANLAA